MKLKILCRLFRKYQIINMALKTHKDSCDDYCNELFGNNFVCNLSACNCKFCASCSNKFSHVRDKIFNVFCGECFCCVFFTMIFCVIVIMCCTIMIWLLVSFINNGIFNTLSSVPIITTIIIIGVVICTCCCIALCCYGSTGNGNGHARRYLLVEL